MFIWVIILLINNLHDEKHAFYSFSSYRLKKKDGFGELFKRDK